MRCLLVAAPTRVTVEGNEAMRTRPITLLLIASFFYGNLGPASAQVLGVGIVHDPLNAVHFLVQIKNQIQHINYDIANLQNFSGGWSNVQQRLANLKTLVVQWSSQHNIAASVANQQIAQLNTELATLAQLQQLADNAGGSVQAAAAQSRLQSELISQVHEQRQLTLAQIKQDELAKQDAINQYHGQATNPGSY